MVLQLHLVVVVTLLTAISGAAFGDSWDVTQPRGKTRVIEFDTTEVTGASVDISPDGKWLLFDLLAHIYRVPTTGGNAEALTQSSGIAVNFHPRYSPDGTEIAFISDRGGNNNIWVMNHDGSGVRQINDEISTCLFDPTWTPDGKHIVVRRQEWCHRGVHNAAGLWMYSRDGSGSTKLVEGRVSSPSVSADGRYVYYHEGVCSGYPPGHNDFLRGCHQLRRIEIATRIIEPVTEGLTTYIWKNETSGGAIEPRASPDGRWLAFARRSPDATVTYREHKLHRTALWLRDLETGAERKVMDPIESDEAEQMAYASPLLPHYGWSSDSKSIVISQGGKLRRVLVATGAVQTIPFKAHVKRTISELVRFSPNATLDAFEATYLRWPTSSPMGVLVFQAAGRLWRAEPDGAPLRRLTSDTFEPVEFAPAWSRDGKWIAFSTWSRGFRGQIWRISADGGEPVLITPSPGDYLNPVWSADGKHVVAMKGEGASARGSRLDENAWFNLVRIDVRNGAEIILARLGRGGELLSLRGSLALSGRVYYLSRPQTRADVAENKKPLELRSVSMNADDPRLHARLSSSVDEIAVSPNEQFVAFTKYQQVYVVDLEDARVLPPEAMLDEAASVRRITQIGGISLSWRDSNVLEFANGRSLYSYDAISDNSNVREISLRIPREFGEGAVAFENARILTMGSGRVIERGSVVLHDGRISCVGECDLAQVNLVMDVAGATIMPGIVDTHLHANKGHQGYAPQHNYLAAVNLAYGVTTAQDPSARGYHVFPNIELIESGAMLGPRYYATGRPVYQVDSEYIKTYDDMQNEVARRKAWGAVAFKSFLLARRDERQWSAYAAAKHGLNITCEASYLAFNLGLIMDGFTGIEHGFTYNPVIYNDLVEFIARSQTTMSMTTVVMGPGPMPHESFWSEANVWKEPMLRRWLPWREFIPHLRRSIKRPDSDYALGIYGESMADIARRGGRVSMGGHGDTQGIASHWEIWLAADGMEPIEALEIATIGGARYIGVDKNLGSLEPGKIADLLVLEESPLEDIRNTAKIRYVVKNGIVYDSATLDQIWPQRRPYGERPWMSQEALDEGTVDHFIWDHIGLPE